MSIHHRLVSLASTSRNSLATSILATSTGGGLTILQAWLLAKIINDVHLGSSGREQILPVIAMLIGVILLRAAMVFINEQSAAVTSERIKSALREQLARKILRLGPVAIGQHKSGELAYTITRAVETLDAYFSQYLPQLFISFILPVGILASIFPIDILSAVILLLTAPLIPVFMVLIGRTTETLTQRQYTAFSRMSAFFLDTLRGLEELKNLGQSAEHATRLDQVSLQYRETTLRVLRVSFLSALVLELATTLSVALIAVEIGIRLLYGQMDFQAAFFLLVISPEFYQPLRQLGARFHAGQNGVSAARKIFEVLDLPEVAEISAKTPPPDPIPGLLNEPFEICFENVSYTYPGREQDAIRSVTFVLRSGQIIALVGLNGSGKSTLAGLLLRFIQPQSGKITCNNIDIQDIPLQQWRAGLAWLDQHPVLINDTIRQNLLLSRPDASTDQLLDALEKAHLKETISTLPSGLDTQLGENAYRLSGGQAQRIGLARAFLKNTPLLILDEPTSHLDAILETDLEKSLSLLQKNCTCLLIAHRKTTMSQADRILVMKKGCLVDQGTHEELLKTSDYYAQLVGKPV